MPTKRSWRSQISVVGFAAGTLIGFGVFTFSGLFFHGVFLGSYSVGPAVLAIALAGGLAIGVFASIKARTWPFVIALSKYTLISAELEAPPVTSSIERGPYGTTYRVTGTFTEVTAKNRGLRGYFVLTVFAVVAVGLLRTSRPGPEHHGVWIGNLWPLFLSALGLIAAYYIFFGSTSIQIYRDRVNIIEGVPGFKKHQSNAKEDISRISVRRYQRGKGTKIVVVIESSTGQALAKFGAELPWQRLCYLKQVLQELLTDSRLDESATKMPTKS